ncbi:uncharacterized protein YktB (UPF0637 family) [Melghiribacillus thermohalophilus]|uniref:UPF0637 protein EDD68_101284 n=1 Tax=Melghiribacillus thermohalophilus TaxID=1324956 RepID=A0A4R3NBE2_9BACI|nr:DUF1054 domain-containing protein [Melghiribacillus thermohalophilus]TCT26927.1 uncharacterized protein YktB (UPF0637 family) [Melghiribacillus thermohalophilus]
MTFTGFEKTDFDIFFIDGLDERMAAIRTHIQPKFKAIGDALIDDMAALAGNEMYVHIAKHARRTKNPPKDTWMAFSHDKRGYKKHPHFQIGLFDDHVFLWLAYIYEMPGKQDVGERFLQHIDELKRTIPDNYVISLDHTKKDAESMDTVDLEKALTRFRDVKKGEFLVGRHFQADDPLLQDGDRFIQIAKHTFETLIPIYRMSF